MPVHGHDCDTLVQVGQRVEILSVAAGGEIVGETLKPIGYADGFGWKIAEQAAASSR